MFAIPKILIRIKRENAWLRAFVRQEKPDAVLSDNRYGLHAEGVFSVFMTHQLLIKTPLGSWADRILQRLNYRAIQRFSVCWVPDIEGQKGSSRQPLSPVPLPLAGELSHPAKLPSIPLRYIGPLSRFRPVPVTDECDLLVLISGPEPQRSVFEKMIRDQLKGFAGRVVLVRGMPGKNNVALHPEVEGIPGNMSMQSIEECVGQTHLRVYDHLPSSELNMVVCGAGLVLSRPGYSSVMDLFKLGKKCIFVPTPGQTEQEYLGAYLSEKKLAVCVSQAAFHLPEAIKHASLLPDTRHYSSSESAEDLEPSGQPSQANGPFASAIADLLAQASRLG